MLTLWKNCRVYAPAALGKRDILIAGEKIWLIAEEISPPEDGLPINVLDLKGSVVCPGLVDMHVHIGGGGGEQGPTSRVPAPTVEDFIRAGVTTILGLLGTDSISRSLEDLLFRARALEAAGLSSVILTGAYRYPSPTICGDVMRDLALIDKVVGVKIALSDHRGSGITREELIRLGSEARIGAMLGGKAGIVVLHLGASPKGLEPLFDALEHSDLPVSNFIPTHCCRSAALITQAVRFNRMGGFIDFTAHEVDSQKGAAAAVISALEQGADAARICLSSDGGGSQPVFDSSGRCLSFTWSSSATLLPELRRLLRNEGLELPTALRFFSENPARALGLGARKGTLRAGADADLMVLDKDLQLRHLMSRGRLLLEDGRPLTAPSAS